MQSNHLEVMLVWRVNGQTYMFHLEVSFVSPFSMLAIRLDLATRDEGSKF